MRRTKRNGGFILCLLFNMLLNLDGLVPAAILLVLHFTVKLSVWWAAAAAALWLCWLLACMTLIGWANRCGGTPNIRRENKNPYSAGKKTNSDKGKV